MKLESLQELYVEELKDLYNAEQQLLGALPKMAKAACAPTLRSAFEHHLEQTRGHIERLDRIFEGMDSDPKGKKCKAMEGLIQEGKDLINGDGASSVRDAALIAAAQRVEHYEMAGYGCVRTYARLLGDEESANLLQMTLDEEADADEKLTELAESSINVEAMESVSQEQSH